MLKVGDKVELIEGRYYEGKSNPLGVEGVVKSINPDKHFCYRVVWSNGWSNAYREGDLNPISLEAIMDKYLEDHNGPIFV